MRMRSAGAVLVVLVCGELLYAQTRGTGGAGGTGNTATSGLVGATIGGATALGSGAAGLGGAANRGAAIGQGQQFGAGANALQQPGGQLRAALGAGLGGLNQQSAIGGSQQAPRRGANARGGAAQPRVRSVTRIAFAIPVVNRQAIVDPTFNAINPTTLPGGKNLRVRFEAGIATLTGSVTSEREARLAGAILALEPGVRAVENELVLTAPIPIPTPE